MHPEVRMSVPVLALGSLVDAVGKRRFEPVEIRAAHIHSIVGDQSGELLANALAHDASLAMVDRETFLGENGRGVNRKALDRTFKFVAT